MKLLRTMLLAGAATALASPALAQDGGISDDAVKIGMLLDMSGPYSALDGQGSVVAVQMAIDEMGGEIDGKKIELMTADHQNKADIGSNLARQWSDQNNVDLILGGANSGVGIALQEVTSEKNIAYINNGAASAALTNENCAPETGIHWTYDTDALANGTAVAMVKEGNDSWYFITADYAFGHKLEENAMDAVKANGGTVVGNVRAPFPTQDFSSFLLQAQGSGAKVIGLANAGTDTQNSVKQAQEFGIVQGGQKLASLLLFLTDVEALGLDASQGLTLTTGFYWDQDDMAREWSAKFEEKHGSKPTMVQAGMYSSALNYLKAVKEAGTDEAKAVVAKLKEMPIEDAFSRNGKVRADGLMVHDMFLAQVKTPDESKGNWDFYNIIRTIPGDDAFRKLEDGSCEAAKG
ncbi:ABC transporter substrate-binding protein [Notoacmeibacter sp. MSK16QG-6]|uniref:ABC transporter substrate-binding protein n=1 Tax=Notoacmeibacter sp. MSK16QG-6 TaxID=2957982 RepID=UPI0020A04441|nr:ABC transporter substrate-binding protein [Notoacmeibacter sp. MSK16QG-6]MCP1198663.1 ABC transporter substrate-binding protein [Notoacmeibacter sp. MSK16QG-6]